MKRLTYIYSLIPLYAVLGFVRSMEAWFGPIGAMAVGAVFGLVVWALVWLRLYGDGRLRPEMAILSVLPFFTYLGLKLAGEEAIATFSDHAWQNMYFLTWCASAIVLIFSVRSTPKELQKLSPQESRRASALTYILAAFIVLYTGLTWMATAADLFADNL